MRNSIYLWFIALLLWIPISFWLFSSVLGCCGFMGPGLSISDGSAFGAAHGSNLTYGLSSAAYMMPAGVKDEFGKLATYLKENPDRGLTLTGQYDDNEKNTSGASNLGVARANSLKKYLVGLGVAGSQIATAGALKSSLSWDADEKNVYGPIAYTFDKLSSGISISDGSKFSAAFGENLNFNQSSYAYSTPLNASLKDVFQKTANYLKANATRSLLLTGYHQKSETNSSALPSLGMARANSVKNMLTSMGAPANQVDIAGEESSSLKLNGSTIVGGVTYAISAKNNDKLAAVTARLAKPLVLYFQTGSNELSLDASQRSYLADLIYYLDNKATGSAVATGHTDNKGAVSANTRLSRKRAEFIKEYLVRNGINGSKISTDGKGPNVPIADNATEAGRAKNRRVEISVR